MGGLKPTCAPPFLKVRGHKPPLPPLLLRPWSKVRVTFGTLSVKHCGFDTDFQFLPNHSETAQIGCYDKRRLIRGNRIKCQGQPFKPLWARYRLQIMSDYFETSYTCSFENEFWTYSFGLMYISTNAALYFKVKWFWNNNRWGFLSKL